MPSDGIDDVITNDRVGEPSVTNSRFERSCRYASAAFESGAAMSTGTPSLLRSR
ncbi:hypothetical protein [Leifsonia xyli]|uniref:hypothetical protein n=1 Tax=Leifsonia xyli TaxID=1575 RepID=UPI003D67AC48